MATRQFTDGAGNGDLTDTGNWSSATVPIAGDSVVFAQYNRTITVGLGSVALASCIVGPGNASSFSAPITTGTITSLLYEGSGAYAKFTGSVTTGVINIARSRKVIIDSGTWGANEIRAASGTIQAAAASVLTNIYNGSADWTIYGNATEIAILRNVSGNIVSDGRGVSDYIGYAGSSLTLRNAALITDGSGTAVAEVGNGASLFLNGDAGTNDTIRGAGTISAAGAQGVQTITDRWLFPGSTFVDNASFPSVISNDHVFAGSVSGSGSPVPA